MRLSIALGAALAFLLATAPAEARKRPPRTFPVHVTQGVVYGQGRVNAPAPGAFDLLLDLYEPVMRSKRRRPAFVLIHGGGFFGGTRTRADLARIAQGLAAQGTVVISIDYRLVGQEPVPSARVAPVSAAVPPNPIYTTMVAAIDDTLTALDWLRGNAGRLRVDMRRLGIGGGSAGAITANHVAYVRDDFGVDAPRLRFVADLWGGCPDRRKKRSTCSNAGSRGCSPSTPPATRSSAWS